MNYSKDNDQNLKIFAETLSKLKEVPNRVKSVEVNDDGYLTGFVLNGFSKSGIAVVKLDDSLVTISTRYDKHYSLECTTSDELFEYIASIAWNWYISYMDRDTFADPPSEWLQHWIDKGLIEVIQKPTYIIRK